MSRPLIASEDTLTETEQELIDGVARGAKVDLGGRSVRGRVLRAVLTGRGDQALPTNGVRLSNGIVQDGLDLEGLDVPVTLLLSNITVEANDKGALILRDARIKRLGLQDCKLAGALVMDRAQIDNGMLIAGGAIDGILKARGTQVSGALAIEGAKFGDERDALMANGLVLSGPLILRRARLNGSVQLARSQLGAGIYAENAVVETPAGRPSMDLESARIDGDILAENARMSGTLCIAHARISGRVDAELLKIATQGTAIDAQGSTIDQGLMLERANIRGMIDLSGAKIGKGFHAEGIEVDGGTTAISANGVTLDGNWDMARGKLVGALNLPGADIRGQFRLTEARLFGADLAIRADGARIRGGCYMSRSMVFGLLRFPACQIGNQFRLSGASLKVEAGAALMVNGTQFGRDVELNDGLQAIGALVLDQVRIPGALDFSNSRIKSAALARDGRPVPGGKEAAKGAELEWDQDSISLADAEVKRLVMPSTGDTRPRGVVDLSRTRAAAYQDFASTWPPGPDLRGRDSDGNDIDHLVLDGFHYDHLNNPSGLSAGEGSHRHADDRVGEQRLTWLEGQRSCDIRNHFKPQPWVQLENRLRQQGYDEDSRQISIVRRRLERSSHGTSPFYRWQGWFLDLFALYGFNPWRTVLWMMAFIALFAAFWAWAGGQCEKPGCRDESVFVMTNRDAYNADRFDEVYPDFNPLAYSFDVFVPFVSFGYADHWRPNLSWRTIADIPQPVTFAPVEEKSLGESGESRVGMPTFRLTFGGILYAFVILETIIGIVLTSLLITGFTGLLRGD